MMKETKYSAMAKEMKTIYLKEHLDDVKKLAEKWKGELSAPPIVVRERGKISWGWSETYKPAQELDPDSNNMIRRHVKSRTLWSHHANWELKLKNIRQSADQIYINVKKKFDNQASEKIWQYTDDYLNTALWEGFEMACGQTTNLNYKEPDNKIGLSFGAYQIETTVVSKESRTLLEQEHREFCNAIAETREMKDLACLYSEVAELEAAMKAIVTKTLKSNDILYTCSFCKHLWR